MTSVFVTVLRRTRCGNVRGLSPFGRHGNVPSLGQNLGEVLVASSRQADEDQLGVELLRARERVRRLERRDDPLGARKAAERSECLVVGAANVLRAAAVAQERM